MRRGNLIVDVEKEKLKEKRNYEFSSSTKRVELNNFTLEWTIIFSFHFYEKIQKLSNEFEKKKWKNVKSVK